jgi:hypothetical protein
LIDYFPETSQGLIAYDKYQGQSKELIKARVFHTSIKTKKSHKKWLYGEDVNRYRIAWNGKEYIDYCDGIANPREPKYFVGERILIREITNPRIYASIVTEELYNDPSVIIVKGGNADFSLKALLGIFNSTLATFYHFNSSPKATKGAFPKILVYDVNNFPIPAATPAQQTEIEKRVEKILALKKKTLDADVSALEDEIDQLVYKLYNLTPAEIDIVEGRT